MVYFKWIIFFPALTSFKIQRNIHKIDDTAENYIVQHFFSHSKTALDFLRFKRNSLHVPIIEIIYTIMMVNFNDLS